MTDLDQEYNYTPLTKPLRITEQHWPEGTVPLVSISCITYNHANFIRDAIEGFLMQETTFPVEILIHDDASTDGTADIVREYEAKYPQLIRPIYQTDNQYSQGNKPGQFLRPLQRGKYIAVCEGDDYWIDPKKLSDQVFFMEINPSAPFCIHNAIILDERNGKVRLFSDNGRDSWHSREDLVSKNFIATASKLIRKDLLYDPDQHIKRPKSVMAGDWVSHFVESGHGNFFYSRKVMSVYRLHEGGVWTSLDPKEQIEAGVRVMEYLDQISNGVYHDDFRRAISLRRRKKGLLSNTLKRALRLITRSRWNDSY
jgi:glycosyltransferase involved in cell wall biosynthesis